MQMLSAQWFTENLCSPDISTAGRTYGEGVRTARTPHQSLDGSHCTVEKKFSWTGKANPLIEFAILAPQTFYLATPVQQFVLFWRMLHLVVLFKERCNSWLLLAFLNRGDLASYWQRSTLLNWRAEMRTIIPLQYQTVISRTDALAHYFFGHWLDDFRSTITSLSVT